MTKALELLHEYTPFKSFRSQQEKVLNLLLNNQNVLAVLPTGAGKSLIYYLASKAKSGITIIISPLISLMHDQVDELRDLGEKKVLALNSTYSLQERAVLIHHLASYDYIFISPEMLANSQVMAALKKVQIALLVVDEAHCMSLWGMDFRVDYSRLAQSRQTLGQPLTLALTATAPKRVQTDIINHLFTEGEEVKFIQEVYNRHNVRPYFKKVKASAKEDELINYLVGLKGNGIVYFSNKAILQECLRQAKVQGLQAGPYHGDMSDEDRRRVQDQFHHSNLDWVFATSAFGMGINKKDIRHIIHYHLPESIEDYSQEIGRAGRDGKPALALAFYSDRDISVRYHLLQSHEVGKSEFLSLYQNYQPDRSEEDSAIINLITYSQSQSYSLDQAWAFYQTFYQEKILKFKRLTQLLEENNHVQDDIDNYLGFEINPQDFLSFDQAYDQVQNLSRKVKKEGLKTLSKTSKIHELFPFLGLQD